MARKGVLYIAQRYPHWQDRQPTPARKPRGFRQIPLPRPPPPLLGNAKKASQAAHRDRRNYGRGGRPSKNVQCDGTPRPKISCRLAGQPSEDRNGRLLRFKQAFSCSYLDFLHSTFLGLFERYRHRIQEARWIPVVVFCLGRILFSAPQPLALHGVSRNDGSELPFSKRSGALDRANVLVFDSRS